MARKEQKINLLLGLIYTFHPNPGCIHCQLCEAGNTEAGCREILILQNWILQHCQWAALSPACLGRGNEVTWKTWLLQPSKSHSLPNITYKHFTPELSGPSTWKHLQCCSSLENSRESWDMNTCVGKRWQARTPADCKAFQEEFAPCLD